MSFLYMVTSSYNIARTRRRGGGGEIFQSIGAMVAGCDILALMRMLMSTTSIIQCISDPVSLYLWTAWRVESLSMGVDLRCSGV